MNLVMVDQFLCLMRKINECIQTDFQIMQQHITIHVGTGSWDLEGTHDGGRFPNSQKINDEDDYNNCNSFSAN